MLIGLGCVQSDDSSLWKNMHSFERSKSGGAGGLLVQRALSEKKTGLFSKRLVPGSTFAWLSLARLSLIDQLAKFCIGKSTT